MVPNIFFLFRANKYFVGSGRFEKSDPDDLKSLIRTDPVQIMLKTKQYINITLMKTDPWIYFVLLIERELGAWNPV